MDARGNNLIGEKNSGSLPCDVLQPLASIRQLLRASSFYGRSAIMGGWSAKVML